MPQLQPGDFSPQLIWLAIIFMLFYLALSRLALPRIAHVIAERKAKIDSDLQGARDAQHQSARAAERYEAEIAAAKAKGQGSLRANRETLEAELGGKREELDRQLAAKAVETEQAVQKLLERASSEMEAMTAGVVSEIVKEFAGVEVSEDEVSAALRQSPKE